MTVDDRNHTITLVCELQGNALAPTVVKPAPMVTELIAVPKKASSPMYVTLSGIVSEPDSRLQERKAFVPIYATDVPTTNDVTLV